MRKNVLEYLESSARMHADKPAFCDENRVFTFGELLKAAQGLGTHLAKTVDTLHKPVAVLIGRTAESVAAMQGVLYAGGCYVPIDDHMPEARIRRIFEQVHPVAIVYAEGNRKQAEPLADCAPLISMDEGFAAPADADLLQSIRERTGYRPGLPAVHLGFDRCAEGNRHSAPCGHRLHRLDERVLRLHRA